MESEVTELPAELLEAEIIFVHFDGAFRHNSGKSACGIFVSSFASPFSKGYPLKVHTSQQAEISGCLFALRVVLSLASLAPNKKYILRGDSSHVIDAIVTGRLNHYDPRCTLPNATLWADVRKAWDDVINAGVNVSAQWVPRRHNCEADELCIATLDGRSPRPEIVSPSAVLSID